MGLPGSEGQSLAYQRVKATKRPPKPQNRVRFLALVLKGLLGGWTSGHRPNSYRSSEADVPPRKAGRVDRPFGTPKCAGCAEEGSFPISWVDGKPRCNKCEAAAVRAAQQEEQDDES